VWVRTVGDLNAAAAELSGEQVIGLDVETTIETRLLCLIQLAAARRTYLIDVLDVAELDALRAVLESNATTKVIHNAEFEREVLRRHGLTLNAVVDTQELSRAKHGANADGGHSLRAVAWRELEHHLDKSQQSSDWRMRPLSPAQVTYAALDAEILLDLHSKLAKGVREVSGGRRSRA
jgi:ribonuclease D